MTPAASPRLPVAVRFSPLTIVSIDAILLTMLIADRLRTLKAERGLTASQLATKARIPVGTVNGYLQGRRRPSGENLVRLAKALGVGLRTFDGG